MSIRACFLHLSIRFSKGNLLSKNIKDGRKTLAHKTNLRCFACGTETDTQLVISGTPFALCNQCLYDHVVKNHRAVASLQKQKIFRIKPEVLLRALNKKNRQEVF